MDRLGEMEMFAAVAEQGSFTAAARHLGVSTSAVSKYVIALEGRLGVRLLNRTTRRLSLTEAGRDFLEWCARIAADVSEAEHSVASLQAEPRGVLRVNAPMSFGQLHLGPVVSDFLARYPDVQIDMTMTDRRIDIVEEGYDVAIRIGAMPDSSLVARTLAPSRRILCGAPSYFTRHGVPRTPEDLAGHNCLGHVPLRGAEEWRFRGPQGDISVRATGTFNVNNGDMLRHAALAGTGLALLPTFIVGPDLADGSLRAVLGDYESPPDPISALYAAGRPVAAKVRSFIDHMVACCGDAPYWDEGVDIAGLSVD
jgi:DNA-binding transcriptional LysR family regulator